MTPNTILVATSNQGKLREIMEIMSDIPIRWLTLKDIPPISEPVEDLATFEGNARKKALHYATHSGMWTLADDSGLEVDVLDGAPGVHSARYAGPTQDSAANNAKLIENLKGIPSEKRSARFRCAIVLAADGGVLAESSGKVEGQIVDDPRGTNGFGYDPHFFVPEHGMTTAEMASELKHSISHRGNALREIRPKLKKILKLD